ncbi:putative membrane protein [Devosia subaequoris]|uniref:Putative membrane protein n=1 Tax=Devosia subaequoris TaxID=395930 RepID=A0A7W6IQX4_9HYPH|nr:putative membrane protein [Devosia subaequoris]
MFDGMMGGGTMFGMGIFWILILLLLVLAVFALVKYLRK